MPTAHQTTNSAARATAFQVAPSCDFDPWQMLLTTPLVYEPLKLLLQLNPFAACQFNSAMALAGLAELNGEHDEALRAINRALKLEPQNPDAHLQHGLIHFGLGRTEESLLSFARVCELNPDCAAAWALRGHALNALGRGASTVSNFEQALRLRPDDAAARGGYGAALYAARRFADALTALDQALAAGGHNRAELAEIRCNHGLALVQLQQHYRALHSFALALELNPKLVPAWCGKTQALLLLERYPEALSAAAHALSHKPDNLIALRFRGDALYFLGRYAEALENSEGLLSRDEQDAEVWSQRGLALAKLERLPEAEESCRRATEINAQEPAFWLNHGFTLAALSRYAEACDSYQQALILNAEYLLAWNNLGMAHLYLFRQAVQQHDLTLAETHWRAAVSNGRRGQAHDWHAEEFNFLHAAAALGHHALALQLLRELEGNLLLLPLQHALEYLLTRDLGAVEALPQTLRAQTEKLINQL